MVKITYGGRTVHLHVGDHQSYYKGPRGPGGRVAVDGKLYKVANWGPDYLSFHGDGGSYFLIKYSARAFTQRRSDKDPWGCILSMTHGRRKKHALPTRGLTSGPPAIPPPSDK